MTVESYLALYTTLFGWQQYANLWQLLAETGLVFVPFLVILLRNFIGPSVSMEAKDASAASVRRTEIDLVLALFAVVLAAQPFIPLSPAVLRYEPPCSDGVSAAPGGSGTTYDASFATLLTDTQVPIWWYGMMALSGGLTHAAIGGIGCVADLSAYRMAVDQARLTDPLLIAELGEFLQACFIPARSRFAREKPDLSGLPQEDLKLLLEDTQWLGSQFYARTPGYYDTYHALTPVRGWPFEATRDTDAYYRDVSGSPPAWGLPYCDAWWTDEARGLRKKLLDAVSPTLLTQGQRLLGAMGFADYSETDLENDTLKSLVTTTLASAPASAGFASAYHPEGWLSGGFNLPLVGAGLGTAWERLSFSPMMYAVRSGAPIVQALILLAIYMLLPFALVLSNYAWSMVATASIALFTVQFWAYLWHVARWLEDNLMRALYPDGSTYFGTALAQLTDGDFALKVMLVEIATALLFIGLPLVFSMIVAWGGYRAIDALGGSISNSFRTSIERGGRKGTDVAGRAASAGIHKR